MKTGNNYAGSSLGDCNGGVYLHRFVDTLKKSGWWLSKDSTGFMVIFKIMRGKCKNVTVHKETDSLLEPDPNYDCHTSKYTLSQFQSMRHPEAHVAARYFVYEFDDNLEIVQVPRQILPYAIVEFKTKSDETRDTRTAAPMRVVPQAPAAPQ